MLRVVAVSAPHWPTLPRDVIPRSLDSDEPFSLENAVRYAVSLAQEGVGAWGESNWSVRGNRRGSVVLMKYLEQDLPAFIGCLERERPNLLLIGCMTLSFPGAIEIARIARSVVGSEMLIVLGGKHVNETMYTRSGEVVHHPGSPLGLMSGNRIGHVFDIVVAGDGEEVVARLGELVALVAESRQPIHSALGLLEGLRGCRGVWLAGYLQHGVVRVVESAGIALDATRYPAPVELFDCRSRFAVFSDRRTAHCYSYLSRGCVYQCYFCSEKATMNTMSTAHRGAVDQVVRQLGAVANIPHDVSGPAAAFVEDSILLGGIPRNLGSLAAALENSDNHVDFGAQFTTDLLLDPVRQEHLRRLRAVGLRYLFWGMETGNEAIARQLSKNVRRGGLWIERNEHALEFVTSIDVRGGVALLFGLGESHSDRSAIVRLMRRWSNAYGAPITFGFSLAVQHPLQGDSGAEYDYCEWGTPADSEYLNLFVRIFGEASLRYPIPGIRLPSVSELSDLAGEIEELNDRF